MLIAAMVENHVHNHLQPLLMGLVDELAILLVGAEAGVNFVIVGCGIAMIRAVDAVVG